MTKQPATYLTDLERIVEMALALLKARRGKTITDPDTSYELYGEHPGEPWRGIHIALLLERRQGGVFKGLLIRHNGELVFSMSNDFTINQHVPGDWERDLERLAIKGDPDTNTPPARLQ